MTPLGMAVATFPDTSPGPTIGGFMRRRSQVEMIVINCLAVLAFASCDAQQTTAPLPEPTDTVNVRNFGAKGDSQTDDTQAFVAALEALPAEGGLLRIPSGTYILTPFHYSPTRGLDLTRRSNITIQGDGATTTVIKMTLVEQRGANALIFVNDASNIRMRDFTLDGSFSDGSLIDEQSHCVDLHSSVDVWFDRMSFRNCKGDGVRLLGQSVKWSERIWIENSIFEDNGRSGVGVQRATREVSIRNNLFQRISDQSIDFEPTGTQLGSLLPHDYLIEGNTFLHSTSAWAITLGGRRISFSRNRVENGAIFVYKAEEVLIADNEIMGSPYHRTVEVRGRSKDVRILNNVIEDGRSATTASQGAITLTNDASGAPKTILIEGNTIRAVGNGVHASDAEDVSVVENEFYGQGAVSGIHFINLVLSGSTRSGFTVHGNSVKNFTSAVRFTSRQDPFANVRISSNIFEDDQLIPTQVVGILFVKTGAYESFATLVQNVFGRGIATEVIVQ